MQTPFHAYIQARELESEISENDFASVFASSDIRVYPFQIAAVNFALRSAISSKSNISIISRQIKSLKVLSMTLQTLGDFIL